MQSIFKDLKQYSRVLITFLLILGCTAPAEQLQKIYMPWELPIRFPMFQIH